MKKTVKINPRRWKKTTLLFLLSERRDLLFQYESSDYKLMNMTVMTVVTGRPSDTWAVIFGWLSPPHFLAPVLSLHFIDHIYYIQSGLHVLRSL